MIPIGEILECVLVYSAGNPAPDFPSNLPSGSWLTAGFSLADILQYLQVGKHLFSELADARETGLILKAQNSERRANCVFEIGLVFILIAQYVYVSFMYGGRTA